MSTTILAPIVLTVLGIIFGTILAVASKVFAVEKDPREDAIVEILPTDVVALGMVLPVGGFLTLGVVIAVVQYFMSKPKKNKEVAK